MLLYSPTGDVAMALEDAALAAEDAAIAPEDAAMDTEDDDITLEGATMDTEDDDKALENVAIALGDATMAVEDITMSEDAAMLEDAAMAPEEYPCGKDCDIDVKTDWLLSELPDKDSCIVTEELLAVLVDVIIRTFEDKEALGEAPGFCSIIGAVLKVGADTGELRAGLLGAPSVTELIAAGENIISVG
jgi:hypothetical protein